MRSVELILKIGAGLLIGSSAATAASVIRNDAVELVGADAVSDPLIAVESNRSAIVNRLAVRHAVAVSTHGVAVEAFRAALESLRADQLLAASLVDSFEEVTAIVQQPTDSGALLQRFVAVTPTTSPISFGLRPPADAYLVRNGDVLTIVKAADLRLGPATRLLGYFVPATTSILVQAVTSTLPVVPKDGPGTGSGSWMGCTYCSNVASGAGSGVAAGSYNAATGQNAFVAAGQNNVASGLSTLVMGGFDNQASAVDAMVGSGAGNRARGLRSVVVGGGYNVASGQWSFVGGGGRQNGGGPAGTNGEDNAAVGDFSMVGAGQGNAAYGNWTTVAGGRSNGTLSDYGFIGGGAGNQSNGTGAVVTGGKSNIAQGPYSFIGGGGWNYASGARAVVAGGGDSNFGLFRNMAVGDGSFVGGGSINYATGFGASVLGGSNNVAGGAGSVALGIFARTQPISCAEFGALPSGTPCLAAHDGTFVFSDGSRGHFRSIGGHTFNVLATGGVRFVTDATVSANEATATKYVDIVNDGRLSFAAGNANKITLDDSAPTRAIGVQPGTVYQRTDGGFAWYLNGVEAPAQNDPGVTGTVLATLTDSTTSTTVSGTFRALAFVATSDSNQKTAFAELDPKVILAKVANLPVMAWSYKSEADRGIRHIGPVAQDFMRLFQIGYDDKSISTIDESGVALAAVKGLKQELDERNAEVAALKRDLAAIKAKLGLQ